MIKDVLLKDGINYVSMDDLKIEAKNLNKISSRDKFNIYRSQSEFAKTNFIQNGSSHKIYYSEMVLADYLKWLDNNYGKKNMLANQNSQDKKRVETTSKEQKTVSTKELESILNTTHDVLLDIVRKVLPNKEIIHGVATIFTEAGLINGEGKDYLAVMFPNTVNPSIYINPKTAVPKLMLWKKNNPSKIN